MGQTKVVEKRFVAKRIKEMPRKKLEWLWPQRIALGTLTVLAGEFQSGKSLLAADLAARVSRGDAWPDGRPGLGPSEVLLLNHEDCAPLEVLEAAGAEMARVVVLEEVEELTQPKKKKGNAETAESAEIFEKVVDGVEGFGRFAPHPRPFSPEYRGEGSQSASVEVREGSKKGGVEVVKRRPINLWIDLDVLDKQLAGMPECRLVIVDPIDAHLTGGNTVAARMWLRSLAMMAAKYRVAMVLVTGLKEGRKGALCRLMGGLGLAGAARGVWMVVGGPAKESGDRGQESDEERKLLGVKNNLSGERTGLAFRLCVDEERGVPRVEWSSEVVMETADEVLEELRQKRAKPSPAVRQAMDFLQVALVDGPRLICEVIAEAKEREGISRTSLERARKELKVVAFQKVIPGPWWVCLKVVDGVDGLENGAAESKAEDAEIVIEPVDSVKSVDGLGGDASMDEALSTSSGQASSPQTGSAQAQNGVKDRNAENAEDAESFDEGIDGVEALESVDGLGIGEDPEMVDGVGVVEIVEGFAPHPRPFSPEYRGEGSQNESVDGVDGLGADVNDEEDDERDEGASGVEGLGRFAPHPRPFSPEYRGEGSQNESVEGVRNDRSGSGDGRRGVSRKERQRKRTQNKRRKMEQKRQRKLRRPR